MRSFKRLICSYILRTPATHAINSSAEEELTLSRMFSILQPRFSQHVGPLWTKFRRLLPADLWEASVSKKQLLWICRARTDVFKDGQEVDSESVQILAEDATGSPDHMTIPLFCYVGADLFPVHFEWIRGKPAPLPKALGAPPKEIPDSPMAAQSNASGSASRSQASASSSAPSQQPAPPAPAGTSSAPVQTETEDKSDLAPKEVSDVEHKLAALETSTLSAGLGDVKEDAMDDEASTSASRPQDSASSSAPLFL
jgi:hypothetical protein